MLFALIAACRRPSKALNDILPGQVQRAWILKRTEPLSTEESPAVIRSLGLRRAIRAVYEGNGIINIRLFEMSAEASAFELIQKWRQQDGLALYKGSYFFVANGKGPDQGTVASFLRAFQEDLKTN
jgi:hypothetical protein